MKARARALQDFVERLNLLSLREIARQAGVQSAMRVTCYYRDGQTLNSCATLRCPQEGNCTLELVREGWFDERPLRRSIGRDMIEKLNAAFSRAGFDRLDDQPATQQSVRVLWLVERAAGTFFHNVLLMPEIPQPPYSGIVNALDAYLPESIREIPK